MLTHPFEILDLAPPIMRHAHGRRVRAYRPGGGRRLRDCRRPGDVQNAGRGSAAKAAHLTLLKRTHPIVILGLWPFFISGLQFGSDVDTFLHSRVFWLKMFLVGVALDQRHVVLAARAPGGARRAARMAATALRRDGQPAALGLTTLAVQVALPNIG